MFEIREIEDERGPNVELLVEGKLFSPRQGRFQQAGLTGWWLKIEDAALLDRVRSTPINQLLPDITEIELPVAWDSEYLSRSITLWRTDTEGTKLLQDTALVSFDVHFAVEDWKVPWSIIEYIAVAERRFQSNPLTDFEFALIDIINTEGFRYVTEVDDLSSTIQAATEKWWGTIDTLLVAIERELLDRLHEGLITRSIEFPPEYREAGTSILTYFSHMLNVKYPDQKVKVRIEQEGLHLRMIIDTPAGQKDSIERTLYEYGLVATGQMAAESFLADPLELMALKNKLNIAELELRQSRELLSFAQAQSQERIGSLEVQVAKLPLLLGAITARDNSKYDLRGATIGGNFGTEGGVHNQADTMSTFDQHGQQVQTQSNAARDINAKQ